MNVATDLKYSRSDEWVRVDGDVATIGITDYAQHELGEVVYLELPEVGAKIIPDVSFGVVESVKAVSELVSPIAGEVIAINSPLIDTPSQINDAPYSDGWMIQVKLENSNLLATLMDAAAYAAYRADAGH